jgi:hypothetical protein
VTNERMGKLITAPLTSGTTIVGHTGICVSEVPGALSLSIVTSTGRCIGTLLDEQAFDMFCLEVAKIVEGRNASAFPHSSATVQ